MRPIQPFMAVTTRIDNGVAVFFEGPKATGEDVAEFGSHGSPAIVEMILNRIKLGEERAARRVYKTRIPQR